MSKLFTYGIFLDPFTQYQYGMSGAHYAVVRGYKTVPVAGEIVEAVEDRSGSLTGLVVDVPDEAWDTIDALESGYKKIEIVTTFGELCNMYVAKEAI